MKLRTAVVKALVFVTCIFAFTWVLAVYPVVGSVVMMVIGFAVLVYVFYEGDKP